MVPQQIDVPERLLRFSTVRHERLISLSASSDLAVLTKAHNLGRSVIDLLRVIARDVYKILFSLIYRPHLLSAEPKDRQAIEFSTE
jgi:hypothetical protein